MTTRLLLTTTAGVALACGGVGARAQASSPATGLTPPPATHPAARATPAPTAPVEPVAGLQGTCVVGTFGCRPTTDLSEDQRNRLSDRFYNRYLHNVLWERLKADPELGRETFQAEFKVAVNGGRVTSVTLVRSSGSDSLDARVGAFLGRVEGLYAPPKGWNEAGHTILMRGPRTV